MTNTVRILAARLPEARKELEKLARKARRYGCPDIIVTEGERVSVKETTEDWDGHRRTVTREYVELAITGDAPTVGNYAFMARVELHPGGNLVDTVPGVEGLDTRFRHTDGFCAHCQTTRARKDVFVVRNTDTGEQLQVGRNCLRDFLGVDPLAVAHRFAFWAAVRDFAESEGGRRDWGQSLTGVVALAAVCVRLYGWCSKGQAQYDEDVTPTAAYVWRVLEGTSREDRELARKVCDAMTDADYATADETIKWVREELSGDSDYTHNLKVIFNGNTITDARRLGLAVSAIAAYHRAQEKALRLSKDREAAAKSQHVGQIGERLRDLRVTLQFQRTIGSNEWGESVLIKFADASGDILTWITSKGSGLEVGEEVLLTGTVKAHGEYNGTLETKMTRCVLKEVTP